MTEKQTIQFNGQTWEEINQEEYFKCNLKVIKLEIWSEDGESCDTHYYRLIPPPETFPKRIGNYEIYGDGDVYDNDTGKWVIRNWNVDNLKLALAESERIRGKDE